MTDIPRPNPQMLGTMPAEISVPSYDREAVSQGVVHLGVGAFHRAHQAAAFEACLNAGDLRWGIVGASLRSRGVADQLGPQDGLYTLCVQDGEGAQDQIIGAIDRVIVAPENPAALLDALASKDTHIVTLTITEKGYMLDPATGVLMHGHDDIAHDRTGPEKPRTAPGFLAKALEMRRACNAPPLTILSCDNVPANGARLRAAVTGIAEGWDSTLADWIGRETAFPQTMVDRIVPATTPEDIAALQERAGYEDPGMVKTEPFMQWVIEDAFAGERPDFSHVPGVQITRSVEEWEKAKLRLLNGAHSTLAYLGALAGIEYIHEVVARPAGAALVEQLWDEAQSTLSPPAELDLAAYRKQLFERFANPALQHRTKQIAVDGSQKLPQRLIEPIAEFYRKGRAPQHLTLGVAAWMQWVTGGRDDGDYTINVDDPLAPVFERIGHPKATVESRVSGLLDLREIFPAELGGNENFRMHLIALVRDLNQQGASRLLSGN